MKLAIICAWRQGEDDLAATCESAGLSAGQATIYQVEDKDGEGPGRTRDRGIEAAPDADVICLIDAHMRFKGSVIRDMAEIVHENGGLLVPYCHHGESCTFDEPIYSGARMVLRAKDGNIYTVFAAKWSRELAVGPRGAVMGACYVFRRDWYMAEAGRPLAILPGWGGDEEVLSVAAWRTGQSIELFDGHVAHRWRKAVPWKLTQPQRLGFDRGRLVMIDSLVNDREDAAELREWQLRNIASWQLGYERTPAMDRFRDAMARAKRSHDEWIEQVCEGDEIDGVQESKEETMAKRTKKKMATPAVKRPYVRNLVTPMNSVKCPHCHALHDPLRVPVTHTYPNGNRRHICPNCSKPFISISATLKHSQAVA